MISRIPIIPTIVVIAAAATMVWLGFWQLGRADEKAALIAEYESQSAITQAVPISVGADELVYRKVELECSNPTGWQAVAGRNDKGQAGFSHRYLCNLNTPQFAYDGGSAPVGTYGDIGWSRSAKQPDFEGGVVEGTLVRLGDGYKVVASNPPDGLEPLATPDPNDLPNNHLAYAGQWFFFALTALVIYFLAIRKKLIVRRQD